MTTAAYLLFYRRRATSHLGGDKFTEIFEKFDNEAAQSDAATESGDEDASSRRIQTRSTKTMVKPLAGSDDDDDELLPSYDGNKIRRSIEDDGEESTSGPKSLNMRQGWNFTGLNGSRADGDADGASDDAQFESSGDERDRASERDTDMASAGPFDDNAGWGSQGVISVPAGAAQEGTTTEEVTEIHLEGDKSARNE